MTGRIKPIEKEIPKKEEESKLDKNTIIEK